MAECSEFWGDMDDDLLLRVSLEGELLTGINATKVSTYVNIL